MSCCFDPLEKKENKKFEDFESVFKESSKQSSIDSSIEAFIEVSTEESTNSENHVLDLFFESASSQHQKQERYKTYVLKKTAWWKQQKGKGRCYHCQCMTPPGELTLDHIVPIVRGGVTNKKNCVPSCKACNTKRKYFLPSELALKNLSLLVYAAICLVKAL
jgi:5-methylcytosine-specific restriction enzyme A